MGQRWATPRQACPQPNGFGRNLRSKTRWFTGFCNSHQVSHFATFFIDAGAEISVAESLSDTRVASPPARAPSPSRRGRTKRFRFPWRVRRRVFVIQPGGDRPHKVRRLPTRGGPRSRTPLAIPHTSNKFAGRTACEASTMILPQLVSRLRSRSLTELTRQIAPPTKNGHAPPPIESRKSSQSVNPYYVWTCAGGTTRPVKARSASPAEGTSRPVHTIGGPGSQHSPSSVPSTRPKQWGNDGRHPGRRALSLMASGATCVQRLDGSRDSAIHTKYRISLRSSSMQEPRYPLPRVFRIRVSHHRPHEHRLRADGGALNDFDFLGAFGTGFLLFNREETDRTRSGASRHEGDRGAEHL
ncbi:hypothetical protein RIF29_46707 [Crotalaria pallida]|uniref:Uncharacterized protein n=1 Tax=Crotalaria pallida TaxID=3830 RepID=A0AAN9DRP4_CROPI